MLGVVSVAVIGWIGTTPQSAALTPAGGAWIRALSVDETHILGIALDEKTARFHVVAHQH